MNSEGTHNEGSPLPEGTDNPRRGVVDTSPSDPQEYLEPGESHRPISVWVVTFMGVLLFWGGLHLQSYSGAYHPLVYDENSFGIGGAVTNVVKEVDPYVLGKRLFADTCAKCHQADGLGLPGQYPPLANSEWVLADSPDRMIRIVLDALQGPVKVNGVTFNNVMTPWRDTLNDQQIAAIITYERTHKEWGHHASPVAPEQVAAIRKETQAQAAIGPWTAEALLAIPTHGVKN